MGGSNFGSFLGGMSKGRDRAQQGERQDVLMEQQTKQMLAQAKYWDSQTKQAEFMRDLKERELELKEQSEQKTNALVEQIMRNYGIVPGASPNAGPPPVDLRGSVVDQIVEGQSGPLGNAQMPPQQPGQLGAAPPLQQGQMPPGTQQMGQGGQQMPPLVAAILKERTGIDFLGAARLGESTQRGQVLEDQGNRRIEETQYNNQFNRNLEIAKYNRETNKVVTEPVSIDGVPHLQKKNAITKEPIGEPIKVGNIKGMPAEAAGKMAMAYNAKEYVSELKDMILPKDKDGKRTVNQKLVWQMAAPMGGIGEGRVAFALFGDAVDSRIRAATGAAVSKEDWELYKRIYLPSPLDLASGPAAIQKKLGRFAEFIDAYLKTVDPSGNFQKILEKEKNGGWSIEKVE